MEYPFIRCLGGKFRDKVRMYCDTDIDGKPDGKKMGEALQKRIDKGFTFLKMDLGIDLLYQVPGALNGPLEMIKGLQEASLNEVMGFYGTIEERHARAKRVAYQYVAIRLLVFKLRKKALTGLNNTAQKCVVSSALTYRWPLIILATSA